MKDKTLKSEVRTFEQTNEEFRSSYFAVPLFVVLTSSFIFFPWALYRLKDMTIKSEFRTFEQTNKEFRSSYFAVPLFVILISLFLSPRLGVWGNFLLGKYL